LINLINHKITIKDLQELDKIIIFKEIQNIYMIIVKINLKLFIKINLMNSKIIIQIIKTSQKIIKIIILINSPKIQIIVVFKQIPKSPQITTNMVSSNLLKCKLVKDN